MNRLAVILIGLFVFAAVEAAYHLVRWRSERRLEDLTRRLRALDHPDAAGRSTGTAGTAEAGGRGARSILREGHLARTPWLARLLAGIGPLVRLEKLLGQADLPVSVAQLIAYTLGLALLGAGLGLILRSALLAVLFALLLAAVPIAVVLSARSRRARQISHQLPEALDMMVRALRAGHGLPAAYRLVAQEMAPPIAVEFARTWEQQHLGLPIEQATVAMAERVPQNLDLRLLAVGVVLQRETGGNLVEILENIAETMRERFAFFSRLRVLTAEGRLSGLILGLLPWVVGLVLWAVNPTYVSELWRIAGGLPLGFAVSLWLAGLLWMRVLLRVEY